MNPAPTPAVSYNVWGGHPGRAWGREAKMDGLNTEFVGNPFGFVGQKPVNHLSMKCSSEDELGFTAQADARALKGGLDTTKVGTFDIQPQTFHGGAVNYYLRLTGIGGTHKFLPKAKPSLFSFLSTPTADPLIKAYWVPYTSIGDQGHGIGNVPWVELPKTNPTYRIMFTGSMNGCSLVVTAPAANPAVIRVYHDSAHEQTTFHAETVLARVDYADLGFTSHVPGPAPAPGGGAPAPAAPAATRYSYGDPHLATIGVAGSVATSFNFLYYDGTTNRWVIVCQPLDIAPSAMMGGAAAAAQSRRLGNKVGLINSRAVWRATIPY